MCSNVLMTSAEVTGFFSRRHHAARMFLGEVALPAKRCGGNVGRVVLGICAIVIGFMPLSVCGSALAAAPLDAWLEAGRGFVPNLGQIGDLEGNAVTDVLCAFRGQGMGIFIKDKGVSYVIYQVASGPSAASRRVASGEPDENLIRYARIDLEFVDPVPGRSEVVYEHELPGYANYYLPQCPDGVLYVTSYREVRIREIYPGIDWVWRYEAGRLHHEFEVSPNADVRRIKMRVKYADIEIAEDGKKLVYSTPIGKIEDGEILAYTEGKEVAVSYRVEDGLIGFDIEGWSGEHRLIIDPPLALLWATYYGGDNGDLGYSMTTDNAGNVFVAGYTASLDFPTHDPGGGAYYQGTNAGYEDAFILKFTNTGVRQWATYYGDNGNDSGYSITADSSGNVFVTGYTASLDFPIQDPGGGAYYQETKAGYYDVFILEFTNTGVRRWATYYGGNDYECGYAIAADNSGNVFVTGWTFSPSIPTQDPGGGAHYQGAYAGYVDAYILKFETSLGIEEKNAEKSEPSVICIASFFGNTIRINLTSSSEKPMIILLYNLLGQKIFSRSYPETTSLVLEGKEIEELSKGIYFLSVYSGKVEIGKVKLIKR